MNRRRFLHFSTGVGIGAGAGCLHSEEGYWTLQRLNLLNILEDSVTTDLKIERADTGELVHEEPYDLQPEGGVKVDCVWPDAPLLVMTRHADGGEWNEYDTTGGEGCVQLLSETHEHGTSFFSSREECPIRSPTCHVDVQE